MLSLRPLITFNIMAILVGCGKSDTKSSPEANPFIFRSEVSVESSINQLSSHNNTILLTNLNKVVVVDANDPDKISVTSDITYSLPPDHATSHSAVLSNDKQNLLVLSYIPNAFHTLDLKAPSAPVTQTLYPSTQGSTETRLKSDLRLIENFLTMETSRIGDVVYMFAQQAETVQGYLLALHIYKPKEMDQSTLALGEAIPGSTFFVPSEDLKKLYATDLTFRFYSFDVSNPKQPQLISKQDRTCGSLTKDVKVIGDKLLVVTDSQFQICDLQGLDKDPISTYAYDTTPRKKLVSFAGDKVFIATRSLGTVEAWSMKDLTNPTFLGRMIVPVANNGSIDGMEALSPSVLSVLDTEGRVRVYSIPE
ncbi:MAG TPA: hypothetical protein VE954_31955 [Oligoflexus sp.]|uniref:hypothetical protein n=1 Tax=Oligoflexus sp. TaxID=1971216 RepID=UPI002D6C10AB|nr:hypothetical protein [Oligoflexus sp.]HYX37740.1 hypothetical protein [Oligoflexus sp.]